MRMSSAMGTASWPQVTANSSETSSCTIAWQLRKRVHQASQRRVQLEFTSAGQQLRLQRRHDEADEMAASAQRVECSNMTSIDDIPIELRGKDANASDKKWRSALFTSVLDPPVTEALPPAMPVQRTTWRPTNIKDLFQPGIWDRMDAWFQNNALDLQWMRTHGAGCSRPHKQRPLVKAQSDMVPEARGTVWDLRRASEGHIEPRDFTAPIKSDLNLEFLKPLLSTCPDRELVSHIMGGVDYKVDLPLQTVLLPHLYSLAHAVGSC